MPTNTKPENVIFPLGQVLVTPAATDKLTSAEVISSLCRHAAADWGDVDDDDRLENKLALRWGLRLFSVYRSQRGIKFWIITEADRSATTVLLPQEY
jgi:hypothetical protein